MYIQRNYIHFLDPISGYAPQGVWILKPVQNQAQYLASYSPQIISDLDD